MRSLARKLNLFNMIGAPLLFRLLLLVVLILFDLFDGIRFIPVTPAEFPLKPVESAAFHSGASMAARPIVAAHRGASAIAPENTMAAFRLARELGADYIELDVQRSRDGRLVVIHDSSVDRTTNGTGEVGELTYAQLRMLDAGGWFGAAFAGQRIPSLDEVLGSFMGRIGLVIELKDPGRYPGIVDQLAAALSTPLERNPGAGLIVQSFDHDAVGRFHRLLPSVPAAVLTAGRRQISRAALRGYAAYASYVNPKRTDATPRLIARIHEQGLRAMVWTAHTRRQAQALIDAGADGIITNDPAIVPGRDPRPMPADRPAKPAAG